MPKKCNRMDWCRHCQCCSYYCHHYWHSVFAISSCWQCLYANFMAMDKNRKLFLFHKFQGRCPVAGICIYHHFCWCAHSYLFYCFYAARPRLCPLFCQYEFVCLRHAVIVMADNLVLLYLGWEGVGLCSYLFIGFWYETPANYQCSQQSFLCNPYWRYCHGYWTVPVV